MKHLRRAVKVSLYLTAFATPRPPSRVGAVAEPDPLDASRLGDG